MTGTLDEMFKHNLWANLRLLDAGAPGTYGTIRATLVHLLAAEGRYVSLLGGPAPERPLRESDGFPGFEALRSHAKSSGQALIELARTLPPDLILTGTRRGEAYRIRAAVPLTQAIHHGNEHRTNVTTIISGAGLEAPDVSEWAHDESLTA